MNLARVMLIITGLCWSVGAGVLITAIFVNNRLETAGAALRPTAEFEQAVAEFKIEFVAAASQSTTGEQFRQRLSASLSRIKSGPLNWFNEQDQIESRVMDLYTKVPDRQRMAGSVAALLTYLSKLSQSIDAERQRRSDEIQSLKQLLSQTLVGGLAGLTLLTGGGLLFYLLKSRSQQKATGDLLRDLASGSSKSVSKDLESEIRTLSEMFEEQRRKIRLVLDNAVDVICLIGADLKFQEVNQAALTSWGYKPGELIGKSLDDIILPEDRDKSLQSIVGAERSIAKIEFENRLQRKDGEVVHVLWSAKWSVSDNGLFCVAHDISARKMAEEMLRESEERVRLIIESLPICVLLVDESGCIELVNPVGERDLAYSYDQLVGEHLKVLFAEPVEPETLGADLARVCDDVTLITRKDQTLFEAEVTQAVLTVRGQTKRLVLISDVSERQQADRLKRQFVAMISHDIKTPLTSLGVILELLLADDSLGQLTAHGRTMVERALNEAERLVKLTKDLLDIEKMETGHFTLAFKKLSAQKLLRAAADIMQKLAEISKVTIIVPETDAVLEADKERLMQVLVNLISNAIKFSPPQSRIELQLEPDQDFVRFIVRDQGRGIAPEHVDSIFEKFRQVEIQDATEKGGTGLGLTICKSIVEQHGGRIGVESTLGEGAAFWFEIPYQPARAKASGR